MGLFTDRIKRLQKSMINSGVDGAIIGTGPNARYFTGFAGEQDRHLLILIRSEDGVTFISPTSYVGQVERNTQIGEVRSVPTNTVNDVTKELTIISPRTDGQYLIDGSMFASEVLEIQRIMQDATINPLTGFVAPIRAIKDQTEQDALRRAATLTDEVSVSIRNIGANAVGMTEQELAVEIRTRLHKYGAEGMAFPVVVAAGPNSAQPTTYRHGDRKIRSNEPVVLDFGGFFNGYASDQTRTVVFDGEPSEEFIEAYKIVRNALKTGIGKVKEGMTGNDLDGIVRDVVSDNGYGDQFITGTGHGVGLRAHEPPLISPDSEDKLETGMVFSIEPGIYIEDTFGVRLETLVILTEDGAEPLNTSPYSWQPL